jgi:hypothetical protein
VERCVFWFSDEEEGTAVVAWCGCGAVTMFKGAPQSILVRAPPTELPVKVGVASGPGGLGPSVAAADTLQYLCGWTIQGRLFAVCIVIVADKFSECGLSTFRLHPS